MEPTTQQEYLIAGYHLLWFVTMMNNYLMNPNQVRAFNIPVYDKNFDATFFGIEADEAFTPFTSKGTVIRFEFRVPTAWKEHNLPENFPTGYLWDTMNMELESSTRQQAELNTIKSITSAMKQRQIAEMRQVQGRRDEWGDVGNELDKISPVYQLTYLCDCLIGSVQFYCTHKKEIYEIEQRMIELQVEVNERHLEVNTK